MAEASYHRNVKVAILYQMLYGVAFSVALGPLFDVYLYQLGGGANEGNELVGGVESVSGLIALALVLPVGFIVDSWDRVKLMNVAGVCGLVSSVMGAYAIYTSSIPWWYATMVVNGFYVQLGNSVCYALFADSITADQRFKATATMGIVANVAQAVGPFMTFLSMLYIGNEWTMPNLQMVLMIGMVIFNPICCVGMFFFVKAPFETGAGDEDEAAVSPVKNIPRAGWVPWLIATSDLITCIGAGMTIKYFNLYWKNDWMMSPTQVLAIAAFQPLAIAICIKLLEKPSEWLGRAQTSLLCFFCGVFAFVVLAEVHNLPIALAFYFIRSGMANAVYPLNKSIMFDFTPSTHRGRWNAVETLSGSVWSGSAFIGGYMADHYSYRFTFLITAGVYAFACLIYSPILCIVPRKAIVAKEGLSASLLSSPGASPTRLANQINFASPAVRRNMAYVSPH